MTPREWNHVLDHKVEWSIAYPAVAREVQALLATTPYPGLTTNELVEALYPEAAARGDGIYARRRIFAALDALREHELADWCHREEPTRARFGKMIRRVRWHQPQAVTEAEEVQTPELPPAWELKDGPYTNAMRALMKEIQNRIVCDARTGEVCGLVQCRCDELRAVAMRNAMR